MTPRGSAFVASGSEAWAVGQARPLSEEGFAPLAEEWNGSAWKIVPTAELGAPTGASVPLNGVSGTGPSDVWAVGEDRSSAGTKPVAEHWNGSSFTNVSPSNSEGALLAVSADSTSDVWAVGKTGGLTTAPLIEHWNGSEWSVLLSLSNGRLSSISAVSANDIYAVGMCTSNQVIEHWNGSSWSPEGPAIPEGPGITGGALTGVSALSASDVWALGSGTGTGGDFQLTEHFNGSKWTVVPSESGDGARSVSGLAGGPLFAVGQGPENENKTLILRQPAP
jgi:hypothetical protein